MAPQRSTIGKHSHYHHSFSHCNPDHHCSVFQGGGVEIRIPVLILLLSISIAATSTAAPPSCLNCHPPHYAELDGCTGCHRGDDRTTRMNIAHLNLVPGFLAHKKIYNDPVIETGNQWLKKSGCRRCHTVNGRGNNLAANLSRIGGRHPLSLLSSILSPATGMPDFGFDKQTAGYMVNAILASAQTEKTEPGKTPVIVRFRDKGDQKDNIFEKLCGGCHQILTKACGNSGKGVVGPNLSGLLTRFYPASYGNGLSWSHDRVRQWLANPRNSRPNARMRPISVKKEELRELYQFFGVNTVDYKRQQGRINAPAN